MKKNGHPVGWPFFLLDDTRREVRGASAEVGKSVPILTDLRRSVHFLIPFLSALFAPVPICKG